MDDVEVLPLVMVTRAFPARPSALPDVRDFVRRQLSGTPLAEDDVRTLCERVADVLLDAAGSTGSIQISLRIFDSSAEVDVLIAPDPGSPVPAPAAALPPVVPAAPSPLPVPSGVPQPTFAAWLSGKLRREGITMEAAANRLNVSAKTISRWVGGTTEPRLRDLYRIREVFGEPPLH